MGCPRCENPALGAGCFALVAIVGLVARLVAAGVIDFLIVLDVEELDDRTRKRMFGSSRPAAEAASACC